MEIIKLIKTELSEADIKEQFNQKYKYAYALFLDSIYNLTSHGKIKHSHGNILLEQFGFENAIQKRKECLFELLNYTLSHNIILKALDLLKVINEMHYLILEDIKNQYGESNLEMYQLLSKTLHKVIVNMYTIVLKDESGVALHKNNIKKIFRIIDDNSYDSVYGRYGLYYIMRNISDVEIFDQETFNNRKSSHLN